MYGSGHIHTHTPNTTEYYKMSLLKYQIKYTIHTWFWPTYTYLRPYVPCTIYIRPYSIKFFYGKFPEFPQLYEIRDI